ncbi:ArsA family ATPase [Streptomyces sp. HNM0575]|nr:ArsA-related P-loop ATPase [Streptomyces sp. HNM0575]NLU74529.1 ArsA family ATPase [Streptomyces sp. HNM0575]
MLLVTGAGGAGRTTVAAASAVSAARDGSRTLLLSGEEPAVLEAVLGTPEGALREGGAAAVPGTDGRLYAARTATDERFRAAAVSLQERGRKVLELLGSDPLDGDELTELPGSADFALLGAVRAAHAAGDWDAVVVDLPHTPEALRTLALPAQLRRYLRRLLPAERQAARALRPALAQLVGIPMPTDALYSGAARWDAGLADVQGLLESPAVSVRLVAEPGPLAAEALRVGRAGLGLYGLPLAAVVANRVLPSGSRDTWTASLSGRQQTVLKAWREEYGAEGVPVCELPHLGREPRGADDLLRLAGSFSGDAAAGTAQDVGEDAAEGAGEGVPQGIVEGVVEDRIAADGLLVWRLALPAVRKEELELVRRGDELILGFGPYRRVLPLPSALRRCRVVGASLDRGELRVRCAPDPALWPEGTGR